MNCKDDTITADMAHCVNDPRFADLVFRFADSTETVAAHKVVLAARSSVMQQALLVNGEWFQQSEVRLDEGVEPAVFKYLLRYMYTSAAEVPYEHLHSMLLLSHRFQVQGLVSACEQYLGGNLTTENLLMNLEVAEICGLRSLRERCAEKLQQPGILKRMLDCDSLRKVALPGLRALLSCDPLPVEEIELFRATIRWAATQVGEEWDDTPRRASREVAELVAPLMTHIRFPTMTGKELRKIVKPYEVVDHARYIEALEYLADVDSDCDAPVPPGRDASLYRPRHPAPAPEQQTPRRRIERLTGELTRLTGSPAPGTGRSAVSPDVTPPRGSYQHNWAATGSTGMSPYGSYAATYGSVVPSR